MFKICLQNRIVKQNINYKCCLCYKKLGKNFDDVQEHINECRHESLLLNQTRSKEVETLSENQRRLIVENCIVIVDKYFECQLCSTFVSNLVDVYEHIKSSTHQIEFKKQYEKEVIRKEKDEIQLNNIHKEVQIDMHGEKEMEKYKEIKGEEYHEEEINEIEMKSDNENLNTERNLNKFNKPKKYKPSKVSYYYREFSCLHCKKKLPTPLLVQCHCMMHLFQYHEIAQNDVIEFSSDKNQIYIKCLVCNKTLDSDQLLIEHLETYIHLLAIKLLTTIRVKNQDQPEVDLNEELEIKNKIVVLSHLSCKICNIDIPNLKVDSHALDKEHQKKIIEIKNSGIAEEEFKTELQYSTFYCCFLCVKSFSKVQALINHYNQTNHQLSVHRLKKIIKIYASNDHVSLNADLLDFVKTITKRKMTKNFKFKINRNLFKFAKIYTKMCINTGLQNIYNISQEVSSVQMLGNRFIISRDTNMFCLLCNCQFVDNLFNIYEHLRSFNHVSKYHKLNSDENNTLELVVEFMQTKSDHIVYCYACDIDILYNSDQILEHIKLKKHADQGTVLKYESQGKLKRMISVHENIWYYVEVYFCYVCQDRFTIEIEFIVHLHSEKHEFMASVFKNKGFQMKFGLCLVCIICWYGTVHECNKDFQIDLHDYLQKVHTFQYIDMLTKAKMFLINAENIAEDLINEADKVVLFEKEKESKLIEYIEKMVQSIYPKAKVYIFGSRLSNLGLLDSDIDIFLDCENIYLTGSKDGCVKYLMNVKSLLKEQQDNWVVDKILLHSRIPIIKLRHIDINLNCDISFINGISVEKSRLIRNYCEAFPICRKMILYLKKWLICCQLFGSDGITTYAISWIVIFYLQVENILPSMHYLLLNSNKQPLIIDGWECFPSDEIFVINNSNLSFKEILIKFFFYFSAFDYKTYVICPYIGQLITKEAFANLENLPYGFEMYKSNLQEKGIDFFRLDSPMCVQDPIDHSHNITKIITKFQLRYFIECCNSSAYIMQDKLLNLGN